MDPLSLTNEAFLTRSLPFVTETSCDARNTLSMQNEADHHAHDLATGQELQPDTTTAPPSIPEMNLMMSHANIGIAFQHQQMLGTFPHQCFVVPLHAPSFFPTGNSVNPKSRQYQRIKKRRQELRVLSAYYERCRRGKKRPNPNYTHESRHRHAQNRPRNRKGHFMKGPDLTNPDKAPNNKNDKSNITQQQMTQGVPG